LKSVTVELFPILTIYSLVSYEFIFRSVKKEISKEAKDLSDPDFSVGVLNFKDIAHPDKDDEVRKSNADTEDFKDTGYNSNCDSLDEDQMREVLNASSKNPSQRSTLVNNHEQ